MSKLTKLRFCYDAECHDLAEYFLPKGAFEDQQKLAQTIQDAIEDWLRGYEAAQRERGERDGG